MYAVGHLGLGYLVTRLFYRSTNLNVALILTLSILPDIDVIIPFLPHRGPTHSIVVFFAIFVASLIYEKGKYTPYMVSYASHLISDVFTGSYYGGTQLLWPLSSKWFPFDPKLIMGSTFEASIETLFMVSAIVILLLMKDYRNLAEFNYGNFLLFLPCGAVLASLFFGYYLRGNIFPETLFYPHLFLSIVFMAAIGNNLIKFRSV